jgi:hypothetical protein
MSNLRFTVHKEDVRGRGIRFWHGPTSYNFDSLIEWRAKHGDPYYTVDSAWRLAVFEVTYPEDWDESPDPYITEVHDEYYENWADAMADGNHILKEPRTIEGPDRAWEMDYYFNANKV